MISAHAVNCIIFSENLQRTQTTASLLSISVPGRHYILSCVKYRPAELDIDKM